MTEAVANNLHTMIAEYTDDVCALGYTKEKAQDAIARAFRHASFELFPPWQRKYGQELSMFTMVGVFAAGSSVANFVLDLPDTSFLKMGIVVGSFFAGLVCGRSLNYRLHKNAPVPSFYSAQFDKDGRVDAFAKGSDLVCLRARKRLGAELGVAWNKPEFKYLNKPQTGPKL
ncbi:MAG: hypothetical protein PHE27_01990 [Alphaproteobacteria bacterium]|nr:hypothetical protein [Alphaproteobacteria bacterium]